MENAAQDQRVEQYRQILREHLLHELTEYIAETLPPSERAEFLELLHDPEKENHD